MKYLRLIGVLQDGLGFCVAFVFRLAYVDLVVGYLLGVVNLGRGFGWVGCVASCLCLVYYG